MRRTIAFTTALGSLLAATSAHASGLAVARFGGEHGNPVTDNPTAIYYNPAGLSASRGFNFFLDSSFAYRLSSYQHDEICPVEADPTQCDANSSNNEYGETPDSVGANYGEGSLSNFAALPMIGASGRFPLGDDFGLAIGAAFFVPFGGSSSWNRNDAFDGHARYPGAVNGPQRWYAIDGTLRSLFVSGAIALSMYDMIHIGVSGGPAFSQVDSIRAKALDGSNNLNGEGRSWLKASGMQGHIGAGIMITPLEDRLRIGFSYQAPVGIDGVVMGGNLRVHDGGGQTSDDEVDFHTIWPDLFRLGVSYKFSDDFMVRAHGELIRWNLLEDQCVTQPGSPCEMSETGGPDPEGDTEIVLNLPRRWQVAGGVRAGASYWVSEDVELFGGLGFDSNAIPDESLEPALLDFNKLSAAIGGRFQFIDELAAAVSYTHFVYLPRDTTGVSANGDFESSSRGPDAGGKYTQILGLFNFNLQVSFDPFAPDEPAPVEGDDEPIAPVEGDDDPAPIESEPTTLDDPPVEEPPAAPPAEDPPAEDPPAEDPPADEPAAEAPPVDQPGG